MLQTTQTYRLLIPRPRGANPRPLPPMPPAASPWALSDCGFFTVSSTLRIRQAASVAAFMAFICTTDGSHTKLAKESAIPPVLISTP
nr:hypothetical protein Iba_chr12bCG27760 [Ipomoea batatas]GME21077.1 hypothetical protein Iba_scaffold26711CG0010 [Ipomoea batatas]